MRTKGYIFCSLIVAALLVSCATSGVYYRNLDNLARAGQFNEAARLTEQSKDTAYGGKNMLLYYMDRGMLLHLAGDYEASNLAFEKAKVLAQDYFTKSITTEASTLLVSDNMRPYYGEDFERALVNVFCALNYTLMGQESEALVEARQVDQFLTALQTRYGHKNAYKEDAFARYLMGMLYENQGQINDAFISYWKAIESYERDARFYGIPVPPHLINDALRTARFLHFQDDIEQLEQKYGAPQIASPSAGQGEIVILHYNGLAPVKRDSFFEIAFRKAWLYVDSIQVEGDDEAQVEQAAAIARSILADEQVRMAFPRYVPTLYNIGKVVAVIDNAPANTGVLGEAVENIGAIAMKNLDDRIARVRVRTIARAAIKYALSQKISQTVRQNNPENDALNWVVKKALKAASTATELADKRSWRSLPDKIQTVRLNAAAGKHSVQLNFLGSSGATLETRTLNDITVRAGKKTLVVVRTVY